LPVLSSLSAGVIYLDGAHVEKVPAHLRNVNTVFQSYALFPHMTVAENIAFGLEMKNVPPTSNRESTWR
jgi:spermidine/putrescine transport system ATP-binding protein